MKTMELLVLLAVYFKLLLWSKRIARLHAEEALTYTLYTEDPQKYLLQGLKLNSFVYADITLQYCTTMKHVIISCCSTEESRIQSFNDLLSTVIEA